MEKNEIWIFIFTVGLIGLNWPLLEIFHTDVAEYLFAFWLIFIILIAFAVYRTEDKKDKFRVNE
jgi:apolipoprotein N-acyltransferase